MWFVILRSKDHCLKVEKVFIILVEKNAIKSKKFISGLLPLKCQFSAITRINRNLLLQSLNGN